jgi:hypothetical protein
MGLRQWRGLAGQVVELEQRVAQLDAELAQERRLQRRVAELTDIVAELLLPADEQGPGLTERLEAYVREA